ncbi:DUF2141 domain-containing protein [Ruegeria denitrificans]|uniref:DUF2141 domain-containing protein n=1 Tax=Ruegeria denitrificans TaxID=1715692 RepID=UPI003C7AFF63
MTLFVWRHRREALKVSFRGLRIWFGRDQLIIVIIDNKTPSAYISINITAHGDRMRLLKYTSMTACFAIANSSFAQSSDNAPFQVAVEGLRNQNGAVIVAGFSKADAFEAMGATNAAKTAQIPAFSSQAAVTFHDLPPGDDAFAAVYDEDMDGDLNMKGQVPTEGYAFAAMGRDGRPPEFKDAAVSAGGTAQSSLRLKYWD